MYKNKPSLGTISLNPFLVSLFITDSLEQLIERKDFLDDIRKSKFSNFLRNMFIVNVIVAFIEVAPSSTSVKSHVEGLVPVHGPRQIVRNIICWVLD